MPIDPLFAALTLAEFEELVLLSSGFEYVFQQTQDCTEEQQS